MHHVLEEAGQHYEKIQTIPGVGQIGVLAIDAHRHHFDGHFQGKEGKYDIVKHLYLNRTENYYKLQSITFVTNCKLLSKGFVENVRICGRVSVNNTKNHNKTKLK